MTKHMYTHAYIHTYIHKFIHTHIYVCVCMNICMYVCMYIRFVINNRSIYKYIYIFVDEMSIGQMFFDQKEASLGQR